MTNVIIYGRIKHIENDPLTYIEVERCYKNQKGIIEKDLIACMYWSKDKRNRLSRLLTDTLIIAKGRIEVIEQITYIIVEEFKICELQNKL